jgi:hypothetical protein
MNVYSKIIPWEGKEATLSTFISHSSGGMKTLSNDNEKTVDFSYKTSFISSVLKSSITRIKEILVTKTQERKILMSHLGLLSSFADDIEFQADLDQETLKQEEETFKISSLFVELHNLFDKVAKPKKFTTTF